MDIQKKLTLAEKQSFWAEQLPNFEAKYWLTDRAEFLVFDMEQGNYVVKDGLDPIYKDDANDTFHRVNTGWAMWKKAIVFCREAQKVAAPEGFVLVPKAESTGLTDKNGKLIFVGNVVEFVGGCRDFLDLSGCGSSKYIVNKGDKMVVRKLQSGYTLSLPWIDCDTPNRIGNLGNYDFWNLCRDFVVIEAQEQSYD